jgi:RNA polymerase sigma-70 factor (ECF subfamily)
MANTVDSKEELRKAFVEKLTGAQFDLFAYISMLVGNKTDARDVLQETNRALWLKSADYDPARPFIKWARAFAHYEVLRYRKRCQRERLVFSNEMVESMAGRYDAETPEVDQRLEWLEQCLAKLTATQRAYVQAKYTECLSVAEMTARFSCSAAAVVSILYRIRLALAVCIESKRRKEARCP